MKTPSFSVLDSYSKYWYLIIIVVCFSLNTNLSLSYHVCVYACTSFYKHNIQIIFHLFCNDVWDVLTGGSRISTK